MEPPTEAPESFCCPITHDLMEDPVQCSDGRTYDRSAITRWLQNHDTSPMTNLPLETRALIPNLALKDAIEDWKRGGLQQDEWTLDPSTVVIGEKVLGRGAWGVVRESVLVSPDGRRDRVAAKSLPEAIPEMETRIFCKELEVLRKATQWCTGVSKLLGVVHKEGRTHIVMKLYEGKSRCVALLALHSHCCSPVRQPGQIARSASWPKVGAC